MERIVERRNCNLTYGTFAYLKRPRNREQKYYRSFWGFKIAQLGNSSQERNQKRNQLIIRIIPVKAKSNEVVGPNVQLIEIHATIYHFDDIALGGQNVLIIVLVTYEMIDLLGIL